MVDTYGVFLWAALFVVFAVGEVISLGLTSIWFAGGAIVGVIVSLFTDVFWIQFAAFTIVSFILMAFTRPIAKKYFNSKNLAKTNVEAMENQQGIVKETIDNMNNTGVVLVNGLEWTAKSESGKIIEAGKEVTVKAIKGVTAVVAE